MTNDTRVYTKTTLSRILGATFFGQAMTALISGAIIFDPLLRDTIDRTMLNLASNKVRVHTSIFIDMLTAVVIILLGVGMYTVGKTINKLLATFALSLYIFEAALLAVSKFIAFALLHISQSYALTGDKALEPLGEMLLSLKSFSYSIHILPFGIGAILFYTLLLKAQVMPKWLILWGLITVPVVLIGVMLMMYGVPVPFILLLPYVPFEFVTGIWILVKGLKHQE